MESAVGSSRVSRDQQGGAGAGAATFAAEVFPAELAELTLRRLALGLPLPGGSDARPQVAHGLQGLALSGGGIRSAAFCLGVVESLIRRRSLATFDYLSTVSGGGFLGGCLSAILRSGGRPDLLDVRKHGDLGLVELLRGRAKYLASGGLLAALVMPALALRGILHVSFLWLPLVVLAVFLTEVGLEFLYWLSPALLDGGSGWVLCGVVPTIAVALAHPVATRLGRDRARSRQRWESWATAALALGIALPVLGWGLCEIDNVINEETSPLMKLLRLGPSAFSIGAAFVIALFILGLVSRRLSGMRNLVLVLFIGLLGPLAVFFVYIECCVHVITSPVMWTGTSKEALAGACQQAYDIAARDPVKESAALAAGARANESAIARIFHFKRLEFARYDLIDQACAFIREDERLNARLVFRRQSDVGLPTWMSVGEQVLLGTRPTTVTLTVNNFQSRNHDDHHLRLEELSILWYGTAAWWFYLLGFLLFFFNRNFLNANLISQHGFYRDRIARAFLCHDLSDSLPRLSELGGKGSGAPCHLINAAVNLPATLDARVGERRTAGFLLSKLYCGSDPTGYWPTAEIEAVESDFDLASAVAVSAAAAGPNMGTFTVAPLRFLLTQLNIRLGYWFPNPRACASGRWWRIRMQPGLLALSREALGLLDERQARINLSDGGHHENLGLFELLRRRCRTIVCVDAEADPQLSCGGLIACMLKARVDLGVRIEIDVAAMASSPRRWTVATIDYGDGDLGTLIHLKLGRSGDEPSLVAAYARHHATFPHQSTADQFFTEDQFEAYRALGQHLADQMQDDPTVASLLQVSRSAEL